MTTLIICFDFPFAECVFHCLSGLSFFNIRGKWVPNSDTVVNRGDILQSLVAKDGSLEEFLTRVSFDVK